MIWVEGCICITILLEFSYWESSFRGLVILCKVCLTGVVDLVGSFPSPDEESVVGVVGLLCRISSVDPVECDVLI